MVGPGVDIWAQAVRMKLRDLSITTVRQTVSEIVVLNCKLHHRGVPMMHFQTLDLMAQKGVKILLRPPNPVPDPPTDHNSSPPTAPNIAPTTVPLCCNTPEVGQVGQCMACNKAGPLWTLCTNCEDSGMVYVLAEAPDDSNEDDDVDKAPIWSDKVFADVPDSIPPLNFLAG
jgi:hypothetical protein